MFLLVTGCRCRNVDNKLWMLFKNNFNNKFNLFVRIEWYAVKTQFKLLYVL